MRAYAFDTLAVDRVGARLTRAIPSAGRRPTFIV
jgi:hypothetical protein